ncbi:helix-turn-helix transcriptional regulator [Nocardiopsis sp. Huas11]|uniref:helix-turn-helix transcriptional regulator n=1 Tax=Nocardiopsis sp. Huas11 TaxID=2183912 RepID=UPI000EB51B2B|nr:helix-turn-helix transcriptional regulator [Nocardiopsis sp. Huas11]
MQVTDLPSVFVGRDRHLAALGADGRRVRREGARALLVCGDAGVGKSRLVDEYLRTTPMARTAVGGCLELGGDGLPFAPFTTLLRRLAREEGSPAAQHRELARLLPELLPDPGWPRDPGSGAEGGPATGRRSGSGAGDGRGRGGTSDDGPRPVPGLGRGSDPGLAPGPGWGPDPGSAPSPGWGHGPGAGPDPGPRPEWVRDARSAPGHGHAWIPGPDPGFAPGSGSGTGTGLGDQSRALLFESVLTFLEERARPDGLTLVIEDLHWADASTRDLLVFLLRNLGDAPVHLLVSVRTDDLYRAHPLRRLLPELQRLPRVGRLDVDPLSRDEVAAQAAGLRGGALDPADVDLLYARSGGNPLFVESFLSGPGPVGAPLPDRPRDLLLSTVERLPETTRRLLGLAATAGDRVDHALLAAVARRAGTTEDDLDTALRHATDAQVLRTTDTGYTFRHALLAEAVYDDLLPGERVRAHRRYAEALERGVPGLTDAQTAVQLAHHAHAARDQPLALPWAWRAADHTARAAAYPEHLVLLERVLELWDLVPDAAERIGHPRGEVLRLASAACLLAGSPRRAADYAADGLREVGASDYHDSSAPPPVHAELIAGLRHARAQALKELGRDGALEDLADAFIVLPPGHPQRAAVVSTLAATLMVRGHRDEARRSAGRVLALARELGDRRSEADSLITLGCTTDPDEWQVGLELLAEGIALAREGGYPQVELRGLNNISGALKRLGRTEESVQRSLEGLRRCEELGLTRTQGDIFYYGLAVTRANQGRFAEAESLLEQVTTDALVQARSLSVRMHMAYYRCRPDWMRLATEEFRRLLPEHTSAPTEHLPVRMFTMAQAAVEGRLGEAFDLALGLLDQTWDLVSFADDLHVRALPWLAEVAVALGEAPGWEEEAEALTAGVAEEADRLAAHTEHPDYRLARHLVMGLIGEDPVRALADCEAAVILARRGGLVLTEAEALVGATRAAFRADDRERAARHLDAARAVADRHGLVLLTRRAELLRLRHHLPDPTVPLAITAGLVPAPARRPLPAGLTRREAEVLAEVAQGRTNPEIGRALSISAKTVSVHMSNLMAKLGVSNRNAAAVRARELGLDRPGR